MSPSAVGVALLRPSSMSSDQSSVPSAGSYDRATVPPQTISVRLLFRQASGLEYCDRSSRSTRQTVSPVAASRATKNDWSSLSTCRNRRPSCSTGELDVPQPARIRYWPRSRVQTTSPSSVSANTPTMPNAA